MLQNQAFYLSAALTIIAPLAPVAGQLQIGDVMPDFTLADCDGDSLDLYSFSGAVNGGSYHVIFLTFFASW